MKKFLNNRPLFFIFLTFGLGIFFARPIFTLNLYVLVFCILILTVITILCVKFKLFKRLVLILVCVMLGFGSYFVSISTMHGNNYGNENHLIVGRVSATTVYDSSENVILDSVIVDGKSTRDNLKVQIFNETNVEVGYIISFNAKISNINLYSFQNFNTYYYKYKITHECSVNFADCSVESTKNLTFAERVRLSVKTLLYKNIPNEEASVCYASLFGDKTFIPSDVKENFSVSGMAHLLAVSGLHVGFVVALISFLLSKLKCKNYLKVGILAVFLGFYCYLCSFASSVMRASIMFLILSLAGLLGKKYDKINS